MLGLVQQYRVCHVEESLLKATNALKVKEEEKNARRQVRSYKTNLHHHRHMAVVSSHKTVKLKALLKH